MSRMRIGDREIRNAEIFETILENFPDIIHSVDENGNIIFTNRTAERMLGYNRAELLAMNIRQLYAPEMLASVEQGFSELKKNGTKRIESLLVAKTGETIPVEIRSFSIYDDQGNFLRTFSILRDISKIKELEEGLIHSGRLAAIGEMASGVAHDINHPLTIIQLAHDMAREEMASLSDETGGRKVEQVTRLLADAQRAADSIEQLARHLRDFSRGTAEALEVVDLTKIINDATFIAGSKIKKSFVRCDLDCDKSSRLVLGSPNRLIQIFVNLISNACDALAGVRDPELKLSVREDTCDNQHYWRCDVRDNGRGIEELHREKLFNSFFTTKPKGKGTGLGLSIARGIARDHKGDIAVETAPGKGSTFSVFLPKAAV